MPFQPYLDELVQWATPESAKGLQLEARQEFFARYGEIFDDDKQFEGRMAALLEYFLFDRKGPDGRTPAVALYEKVLTEGPPERAAAFRAFTETVHGLFEVKKLSGQNVRLRELFVGMDYDVTERRQHSGLTKGDILEARLIPFGGEFFFSTASTWHPREAVPLIHKQVKKLRKLQLTSPSDFLADCAKRALKADRYRNIAIEKIYDFGS